MTSLELDRYSEDKADQQAELLNELVRREKSRLASIFPGAVRRYEETKRARESVLRISESKDIDAYIIQGQQAGQLAARGIATVIYNQIVLHSELGGPFTADDMDYWIDREADPKTAVHLKVADKLIDLAVKSQIEGQQAHPILATRRLNLPIHAAGLFEHPAMIPISQSGNLSMTDNRADVHGVTHDGAELAINMVSRVTLASGRL